MKRPIPDEFYKKIICDHCEKILFKFLESTGFIQEESFYALCQDCFNLTIKIVLT
jgi:hypothetical protein